MASGGEQMLRIASTASFLLMATGPALLGEVSPLLPAGSARMGGAREASVCPQLLHPFQ